MWHSSRRGGKKSIIIDVGGGGRGTPQVGVLFFFGVFGGGSYLFVSLLVQNQMFVFQEKKKGKRINFKNND